MSTLGDRMNAKLVITEISPGQSVGSYLDDVITQMIKEERSIKADLQRKTLDEKDKQGNSEDDDIFAGTEEPDADLAIEPEEDVSPDTAEIGRQMGGPQEKQVDADVEALESVPEMNDVIDKLNAVRSGKSFKDDDVKRAFEAYFDGLDDEEKIALFAFMKGIAQVTSGEVSGEEAVEPDTAPSPGIEMKKKGAGGKSKRTIKPNVIKKPDVHKSDYADERGEEDTTPPVPVQAKQRR